MLVLFGILLVARCVCVESCLDTDYLKVIINVSKPLNFIRPYGCSKRTLVMKIIISTFPETSKK